LQKFVRIFRYFSKTAGIFRNFEKISAVLVNFREFQKSWKYFRNWEKKISRVKISIICGIFQEFLAFQEISELFWNFQKNSGFW
jgi:hypothetical protein